MERVYHIDVIEVGRSSFVRNVDRMFQRQVPYRERLEFGVSGFDAPLVLLIELAEAHCHFPAARSRCCDYYQRFCGLHIVIFPEPFIGVDESHIVGVAVYGVMVVGFDAEVLEALSVGIRTVLPVIMSYDHRIDKESAVLELVSESQNILVVCDSEVLTDFVLFYVNGADDNNYFGTVAQLLKHLQLAVRKKSWQDAARMEVVEEFAAELKVEFVAEFFNPFDDMLGLYLYVFVVVETVFHVTLRIQNQNSCPFSDMECQCSSIPEQAHL